MDYSSYESPRFSKKKVMRSGYDLVNSTENDETLIVFNNWRSSHALPLDIISECLKKAALEIDDSALIAKRLKRAPSIINKLSIQKNMSLSRMQDIGGCRAIVNNLESVYKVRDLLVNNISGHILVNQKDYIQSPKQSGYRGIHLVYKLNSPDLPEHNGMMVEVQIRTKPHHFWATAVETMGAFLQQSLKSSIGDTRYLNLFAAIADIFALRDGTPVYFTNETIQSIYLKIFLDMVVLKFKEKLGAYRKATEFIAKKIDNDAKNCYYLIINDFEKHSIKVRRIPVDKLKEGNEIYTSLEQTFKGNHDKDVVLVSSKKISELQETYPNYFSDTHNFLKYLDKVMMELESKLKGELMHSLKVKDNTLSTRYQIYSKAKRTSKRIRAIMRAENKSVRRIFKRARYDKNITQQNLEDLKIQYIHRYKEHKASLDLFSNVLSNV